VGELATNDVGVTGEGSVGVGVEWNVVGNEGIVVPVRLMSYASSLLSPPAGMVMMMGEEESQLTVKWEWGSGRPRP